MTFLPSLALSHFHSVTANRRYNVEHEIIVSNAPWASDTVLWTLVSLTLAGLLLWFVIRRYNLLPGKRARWTLTIALALPALLFSVTIVNYNRFNRQCEREAGLRGQPVDAGILDSILIVPEKTDLPHSPRYDRCGAVCLHVLRNGAFEFVEQREPEGRSDMHHVYTYRFYAFPDGDPACRGTHYETFGVGNEPQRRMCITSKPSSSTSSEYGIRAETRSAFNITSSRWTLFKVNDGTAISENVVLTRTVPSELRIIPFSFSGLGHHTASRCYGGAGTGPLPLLGLEE